MEIKITITADKEAKVKEMFAKAHPIPEEDGTPLYTAEQWVNNLVKQFIMQTVLQGERKKAAETSIATITKDNALFG